MGESEASYAWQLRCPPNTCSTTLFISTSETRLRILRETQCRSSALQASAQLWFGAAALHPLRPAHGQSMCQGFKGWCPSDMGMAYFRQSLAEGMCCKY